MEKGVLGGFSPADDSLRILTHETENVHLMCMKTHPCDCQRFNRISIRLLEMSQEAIHLTGNRLALTSELTD